MTNNKIEYQKNKVAYHLEQLKKLGVTNTESPNTEPKVTKVSYGRTYNTGNYSSERIDFEAEVTATDDIQEVVRNLDKLCLKNSMYGVQTYKEAIKFLESNLNYGEKGKARIKESIENLDVEYEFGHKSLFHSYIQSIGVFKGIGILGAIEFVKNMFGITEEQPQKEG